MHSNWFVSFFSPFFLDAHGVSSSFTGIWVGWTALSRFFTVPETLKQEGFEFATSLVYKVRPCLKIIREQRKVSYGEKERGREEERRKELLTEQRKQKAREEASCWGLLYLHTSSLAYHMEIDRTWDFLSQKQNILLLITQQQLHIHVGPSCLPSSPRMKLNR